MKLGNIFRIAILSGLAVAAIGQLLPREGGTAFARSFRGGPAGSWLVTYNVPAFGGAFPVLLSLAGDGVSIETDTPALFPLGNTTVILSNGHGAWEDRRSSREFSFLYRKLIYQKDGLTPFGTTRSQGTATVSSDGSKFEGKVTVTILDTSGQVLFEASGTAVGSRIDVP